MGGLNHESHVRLKFIIKWRVFYPESLLFYALLLFLAIQIITALFSYDPHKLYIFFSTNSAKRNSELSPVAGDVGNYTFDSILKSLFIYLCFNVMTL
jgi:hypothetical protein